MSNTIKRITLDDGWSIGRSECWFTDMAENGLHLQSIGRLFARFRKGEPRKTRYRIIVLSSAPTGEQIEIYKECGWEYVTKHREFYIFSSPEEADCSELPINPMEQAYTLTKFNKRLKNNLILITLLMALFLGLMTSMFFLDDTPVLSMMDASWVQRPLLVLVELYVFYTILRNYIIFRNLRKTLLQGKSVNHRESWRKHRYISGSVGIFFIIIAVFSICIPIIGMAKSQDYTLPETTAKLPIIRLAEIEQNPNLQREVRYNSRGVDWGNRVSYDWSIFAPIQYEVNEHGIILNAEWEDKSGKYSPSIETQYYELTIPQMKDGLVDDLIERYVDDFNPNVIVKEAQNPVFDNLFVAEDSIRKQIFASYGNKVIYVSYYGHMTLENIIVRLQRQIQS